MRLQSCQYCFKPKIEPIVSQKLYWIQQTTGHCNKQQPFDVYHTKPRVRCSHENHLGVLTNKSNDANINSIILKRTFSRGSTEFIVLSSKDSVILILNSVSVIVNLYCFGSSSMIIKRAVISAITCEIYLISPTETVIQAILFC